jgi:coenzyme F420-reducing hydrogenase gamma subunit
MKKLMMKLHDRQPPQKNGVSLMVMVPARDSDGTSIIPKSKIIPIDLAMTGCFPKTYRQTAEVLFRVAKPSNAPKNAPANKVTDMVVLLEATTLNLTLIIGTQ